jgi:hypothetical protein
MYVVATFAVVKLGLSPRLRAYWNWVVRAIFGRKRAELRGVEGILVVGVV